MKLERFVFTDKLEMLNDLQVTSPFCTSCLSKKKQKCYAFYSCFKDKNYNAVKHVVCPYGYSVFLFSNIIYTSIITNKSNLKLLKKRSIHLKRKNIINKQNKNEVMDYDLIHAKFTKYLAFDNYYSSISSVIHDISGAMSTFLDAIENLENTNTQIQELCAGYIQVNNHINYIRDLKRDYIPYRNDCDYDDINLSLISTSDDLFNLIEINALKAEKMEDSSEPLFITLSYGFDLFWSFYKLHLKRTDDNYTINPNEFRVHKPHKMFMRLIHTLQHKASKRKIQITLSSNSKFTKNTIRNVGDIYLAFFSLLENAIKHALSATKITVDIEDIEDEVQITITNKCHYISKEQLNCLKEKGYRVNIDSSESSGYGLFIVDQIFKNTQSHFILNFDESNNKFSAVVRLKNFLISR